MSDATNGLDPSYADYQYRVRLEVTGNNSRLDILVESPREFLIGIEVKIQAGEGKDQTLREWTDLCSHATRQSIPEDQIHAYFLTPEGTKAQDDHFHEITWRQIAEVFERFASKVQPEDVVLFARHCARVMERLSGEQSAVKEK